MKPTNDERREVAARLRRLCGHREVDKEFVHEALGLYMGECVDGYDPVSVSELADLIEPEERTCRCGVKTIGQVFPDGFDFDGEYTTVYIFPLSCGHEVRSLTNRIPRFCPKCGAKVVCDA